MINIRNNDLWRGTQKIGYVQGNDIRTHEGKKLGYFEGDHIYDASGKKIAYIQGNEVHSLTDNDRVIKLDENRQHVNGGELADNARAAIRLLLGD